jgi:ribosomal protein S18 acetylase RimI-like enzyme
MLVRTAIAADAPKIARINVETWRMAYRGHIPDADLDAFDVSRRTTFWQRLLAEKRGEVFVAEDGGGIMGFCNLIPTRDKDGDPQAIAEIAAIYVLPQHWRKGAGRALCGSALAEARRRGYKMVTLWVLASNGGARRFYEAVGFGLDGASQAEKATDGSVLHEVRFCIAI